MKQIAAKGLVLISCIVLLLINKTINTDVTVSILLATIASALPYTRHNYQMQISYPDKSLTKMLSITNILFIAVLFFMNPLCFFIPVIIFEGVIYKNCLVRISSALAFICAMSQITANTAITLIIICIFAGFLAILTAENNTLHSDIKKLRDTSTEHELMLAKSNKLLKQNQDDAVYMATLQERNRIAREIHDNVGHLLTRSILQTGAIKTINKNEAVDTLLVSLKDSLDTAMTTIRNSVHDLHDESIDLKSSIEQLTEDAGSFKVSLDYDATKNVPKNIKYAFIAITKEAVNNAVKHSNGDEISILLREHPGFYQLMIYDNGSTASSNKTPANNHGIGLSNISDRVNEIGGNLQITTDNGFKILVTVMR